MGLTLEAAEVVPNSLRHEKLVLFMSLDNYHFDNTAIIW